MTKVLVVENHLGTSLGQLGKVFAELGVEVDLRAMHAGASLPDEYSAHDALVVLGGIQNALDDQGSPWFGDLLDLMRAFEAADKPILGICLGAQLIARAFGGDNLVGATHEFGWTAIELNEDGRDDPVLGRLPDRFTTFQWHDDTFTKPRRAVRLAGNDASHNQAFRIGRACYATQFHFEADRPLVDDWSTVNAEMLAEREPHWENSRREQSLTLGAEADRNGRLIAQAWVSLIR